MRVWLLPSAFSPHRGGVEELTLQLARQLGEHGHEVLVVTNRHPPELPGAEVVEGIQTRRLTFGAPRASPMSLIRFAIGVRNVQRSLAQLGPAPDLIHIQCASTQTAHAALYCARQRLPLVVSTQGEPVMDANQIFQHSAYMRWAFRLAASRAAVLTACSAWAGRAAADVAPAFSRAIVVPNGVDPSQWDMGPKPDSPVVCAWGRHVPQKGFDLAITAFARLRLRVPDARLLIGGEGTETWRLRELAGPGVEFLGPLDRAGVRQMLGAARVAVVPSRVEPFGIVALEALAAGRGLVYAANTGIAEAAGETGRSVDVNDADALAEAMRAELADPTNASVGRARAEELSWGPIAGLYTALYEDAIATARLRPR